MPWRPFLVYDSLGDPGIGDRFETVLILRFAMAVSDIYFDYDEARGPTPLVRSILGSIEKGRWGTAGNFLLAFVGLFAFYVFMLAVFTARLGIPAMFWSAMRLFGVTRKRLLAAVML